jgi:hypothetical protein
LSALPHAYDVLAVVLAEVQALRGEVAELREALARRPADGPAQDIGLVVAIRLHVADALFSASELIEHARLPQCSVLAAAIVASIGALNGRRLGQFLKRMEGVTCDGLQIARIASDRDGAVWRVWEIANPHQI